MKKLVLILLFTWGAIGGSWAQIRPDSVKKASGLEVNTYLASRKPANLITVSAGLGQPLGDWQRQYGWHGQITAGYLHRFPSRVTLGAELAILFGRRIKSDPTLILRDKNGNIIGYDGNNAEITYTFQGYRAPVLSIGYFIPTSKKLKRTQPEYGVHLALKGGCLIYKTRIYDPTRTVPLLDKTNRRGFDNLRAGPMLGFSAGYWYGSPKGTYAFYLAVEPYIALTQSQRSFNYNLGYADTKQYFDQGILVQFGFSLMLFQLGEEQEYFYY